MTGFLMKDKARFAAAGLLPGNCRRSNTAIPPTARMLWLYEQPSDYYRRHLLLHEGTHGFMYTLLGSCGPPWYMEGMAEYLGTHRWQDGRLDAGLHAAEAATKCRDWGRIRIIQDAVADRRALRLTAVHRASPGRHTETEPYAWCWAAVTLLDRHPRYQQRFRQLFGHRARARFQRAVLPPASSPIGRNCAKSGN